MKIGIINFLRIVLRIFYIFPIKDNYFFLRVLMAKVIMIILSILVNIFQIDISNIDKYGLLEIIFLKQL